jgi:hypothetical protein
VVETPAQSAFCAPVRPTAPHAVAAHAAFHPPTRDAATVGDAPASLDDAPGEFASLVDADHLTEAERFESPDSVIPQAPTAKVGTRRPRDNEPADAASVKIRRRPGCCPAT